MKRYETYKDSGEQWIGEIPSHWETRKLNDICSVITDFVASGSFADLRANVKYLDQPDYAMLVRTADLSLKKENIQRVYISEESYNYLSNSNLFGGEIVLPNIGSVGDVYLVPTGLYSKMSLAPNSIMLRTNGLNRYFYYFFLGQSGRESILQLSNGAVQGKFNKTQLRLLRVPNPPLTEQKEIAAYLDRKCTEIEAAIKRQQRMIDLLTERKQIIVQQAVTRGIKPDVPLKDSGIPWIGTIPEHWKIERAKVMFNKENRPVREEDEVITCFRDGQVTLRKNRRTTGFTESLKEIGYQGVRKGDLVIHQMDAFAGAIGVSDSDGKGTPVYHCCTPKGAFNPYYYQYLVRIMAYSGFIQSLYRGIRERSSDFRFEVFAAQRLVIPPYEEQQGIVDFIEAKLSVIDKTIAKCRRMIDLLNERKQIIISEVVTGKVKVS